MTTKEKIEVMQAYEDGKTIECRSYEDNQIGIKRLWGVIDSPNWNWQECEYRVKPEEKFVNGKLYRCKFNNDNSVHFCTCVEEKHPFHINYKFYINGKDYSTADFYEITPIDELSDKNMTNFQLAFLLSKGYGQKMDSNSGFIVTYHTYRSKYIDNTLPNDNEYVGDNILIRKFGTGKWVKPTYLEFAEYMANNK